MVRSVTTGADNSQLKTDFQKHSLSRNWVGGSLQSWKCEGANTGWHHTWALLLSVQVVWVLNSHFPHTELSCGTILTIFLCSNVPNQQMASIDWHHYPISLVVWWGCTVLQSAWYPGRLELARGIIGHLPPYVQSVYGLSWLMDTKYTTTLSEKCFIIECVWNRIWYPREINPTESNCVKLCWRVPSFSWYKAHSTHFETCYLWYVRMDVWLVTSYYGR